MIDTSQTILKLKVRASQVNDFPFDVVYVVDQALKHLIPHMFPYSLCLPINNDLCARLYKVQVDEVSNITMTEGKRDQPLHKQSCTVRQCFGTEVNVQGSFLIIPVLPRTHQKTRSKRRKDRNPAYLLANMHRRGEHETRHGKKRVVTGVKRDDPFLSFFNDFAVMFTPRGPKTPICLMCPRHLEHVQGKCSLGEQQCYESLILQPQREKPNEQLQKD